MNVKTRPEKAVCKLREAFEDIQDMTKEEQNEVLNLVCSLDEMILIIYGAIVDGASIVLCPDWKE